MRAFILVSALLISLFFPRFAGAAEGAQAAPETGQKIEQLKADAVLDALRDGMDIKPALQALSTWPKEEFERYGVVDLLTSIIEDEGMVKSDREAALDALRMVAIEKKGCPHRELAVKMLGWVEKAGSPTLAGKMLDLLLSLDNIEHDPTEKQVGKLLTRIMLDAARPAKDREFCASVHASAFRAVTPAKANKDVVESMVSVMSKAKSLDAAMQMAAFRAMGSLLKNPKEASRLFTKAQRSELTQNILSAMKENPALVSAEVDQSSEVEKEMLRTSLLPLGLLMADAEVQESFRSQGAEILSKLSGHKDIGISERAGTTLIKARKTIPDKNIRDGVALILLETAKKRMEAKAATPAERESGHAALRLLVKCLGSVLRSDNKKDQEDAALILGFLKLQFLTSLDLGVKEISAQGFFALEPSMFTGAKPLGDTVVKEVESFFIKCMKALEVKADDNPLMLDLQKRIAAILYEITGVGYGTDHRQWTQWKESPQGKKFFK